MTDKSVQAIVTSPPYFNLRKYDIPDIVIGGDRTCQHTFGKKKIKHLRGKSSSYNLADFERYIEKLDNGAFCACGGWKGQYGLEPDFRLYIEHTRLWAKEAWRVLRDDGVMFLNFGDSYSTQSGGMAQGKYGKLDCDEIGKIKQPKVDLPSKCKLLIPHRIAIALIDDGWICRNDLIWFKPNAMPESVTDRFSKRYEYIFMFSKQERYYFDLDAVRELQQVSQNNKWKDGANGQSPHTLSKPRPNINSPEYAEWYFKQREKKDFVRGNKNLIEGMMASRGIPKPNLPHPRGKNPGDVWQIATQPSSEKHYAMYPEKLVERMVRCSTKQGDVVLDPFCGSGTTVKVAETLGRQGTGIDLGYKEIQERRLAAIEPIFI